MKPEQLYKFKLPILHWLFFLFLAVGVSDLTVQKQIFHIEAVDALSQEVSCYSPPVITVAFSGKVFTEKSLNLNFLTFKYLSNNLNNKVNIIFSRYSLQTINLPQNKILHFRNRNLTSKSPEGATIFIS